MSVAVMSVMSVVAVTDPLVVTTTVKEATEVTEVSIDVVVEAIEEMIVEIVASMCPETTVAVKMIAWDLKEINSNKILGLYNTFNHSSLIILHSFFIFH
ncbi:hypothetical protein FB192DRAFT_1083836 [Mucor lusitanicus]|uniref:Secreted protein n=1 Tax=Mucor circinelloides f. lusitanicus TaxID=29924 RepID=A0A8H4BK28_MUCCL|nr:hypothetical protein FB192DRAFT_1083836 [Mucor lusitanicus]